MVLEQVKINRILKYFDHGNRYGSHVNCIRLNPHNSYAHEFKKFELAWEALKDGRYFLTEAIFFDRNGIADFVDLSNMVVVEILHSETEEEFMEKIKKYPRVFNIEKVIT